MLIVAGTFNIDPTQIEAIRGAATTMMAATHQEPGNVEYVFSISLDDPGTVQLFEVWESAEDLEKHMTLPHMAIFQQALSEVTITGRDLRRYEIASSESL